MSANNQPYALISVSDKKGLVDFVGELKSFGYKFISTSGSAALLQQANLPCYRSVGNHQLSRNVRWQGENSAS